MIILRSPNDETIITSTSRKSNCGGGYLSGCFLKEKRRLRAAGFFFGRHQTAEHHTDKAYYEGTQKGGLKTCHVKAQCEFGRQQGGEEEHQGIYNKGE